MLLITTGLIIIGTAVAMGITILDANSVGANKDALTADCLRISSHAEGYYGKPALLGGGEQQFDGITLDDCGLMTDSEGQAANMNGTFTISRSSGAHLTITAVSAHDPDRIVTLTLDMLPAKVSDKVQISYTGW